MDDRPPPLPFLVPTFYLTQAVNRTNVLSAELGTSLLLIERTLKSDEWSLIFWVKENEWRAESELAKKRVRTSLKAIAQFKRACILNRSLSERCNHGTSTPPPCTCGTTLSDFFQYFLVSLKKGQGLEPLLPLFLAHHWPPVTGSGVGREGGLSKHVNFFVFKPARCLQNFATQNFVCFLFHALTKVSTILQN
jgi:hypothetical protein